MTVSIDTKKLELVIGREGAGMGFRAIDKAGDLSWVTVWFPDLDPVKGLEMLDQLRDELEATVLDSLLATPRRGKKLNLASPEHIDAITKGICG